MEHMVHTWNGYFAWETGLAIHAGPGVSHMEHMEKLTYSIVWFTLGPFFI